MSDENKSSIVSLHTDADSPIDIRNIDVIVPVYKGYKETRHCLESLLAAKQQVPYSIIVIDDCSPEKAIVEYLDQLQLAGKIALIRNKHNQGFVWSVNRGMGLHPDRDVVLLNADTEVNGNWLDRLARCAYSSIDVATVTPFSNNATICSYPRFCVENEIPAGLSVAELDDLFAGVNSRQYVEIPTAVGFCMFIRRHSLDQVGFFDAVRFKNGYGEENDFCVRATNSGFRHLLCGDTFVYHKGRVSFADKGEELYAKAQHTLNSLHPQYSEQVAAHVAQDPARNLRRRADIVRLIRSRRPKIVFITHSLGGGTEKHVQDLATLLAPRFEVLILRPCEKNMVSLEWARESEDVLGYFPHPFAYQKLVGFLKKVGTVRIHIHHVIDVPPMVWKLPNDLGVPYDFTLHDYYSICPQYNLARKDGRYCGEPSAVECNACLAERPAPWGMDIDSWRAMFSGMVGQAERVIGPSRDVIERMKKYVPNANYVFLSHPEPMEASAPEIVRTPVEEMKIVVLASLSLAKGIKHLEACAKDAQERGLPLFFHLIGSALEPVMKYPEIPLTISGRYEDTELHSLIARERADMIFFPALWPETYSYTLSAAKRTGLAIAAPNIGAFPERLDEYHSAHLLDWKTTPAGWNDFFMSYREILQRENSEQEKQRIENPGN